MKYGQESGGTLKQVVTLPAGPGRKWKYFIPPTDLGARCLWPQRSEWHETKGGRGVAMTGSIHNRLIGSAPAPTAGFWNFFLGCVGFLEICYSEETPGGTQDDIHW